ncbi:DUF3943 domain-containing protein [Mucilaginibacter sp. HD30]
MKLLRPFYLKSNFSKLFIAFAFILISDHVYAQVMPVLEVPAVVDSVKRKKPPVEVPREKHFGRAAFQTGVSLVTPWLYDKFVVNKDYADINLATMGRNLKPTSWEWDRDPFQTNQFGHPYHGSLYFNSFRANGYNFWESIPGTVAGTLVWETLAETERPSINDAVNTTFGGIVLGEMTYRLSNMIVNNRGRGFKRYGSEVLAFVVSPMNGFNRIITGKFGKSTRNTIERDSSKVLAEFDLGYRRYNADNRGRFGWYGHMKFIYGTAYQGYRTPFSNIVVNIEGGKDDSSLVNVVSVYGSLAGWRIRSNKEINHVAVLSANYDYINNQAFFYGGQSVKINLISEFTLPKKFKLTTNIGAGPILLGAVPDDHIFNKRNYDYGIGFAVNGGGTIALSDKICYGIHYNGGYLNTVNGNPSHYYLNAVSNELDVKVIKNFSVVAESGYFTLQGNYKDFPDVVKNYPYVRVSARLTVNFNNADRYKFRPR